MDLQIITELGLLAAMKRLNKGLSHSALYRHFRSKADIFDALAARTMLEETDLAARFARADGPAAERNRGVTPSDRAISFGAAWTFAGVMEAVWRIFRRKGEPPITRQMPRLIGMDFTVDISRARKELGYVPVISPVDGIRQIQQSGPSTRGVPQHLDDAGFDEAQVHRSV